MTIARSQSSLLTTHSPTTRRRWLGQHLTMLAAVVGWRALGAASQQLPPGAGVAASPPCDPSTKPTPARKPAGFRIGAPMRTRLTDASEKGQLLTLTGAVIGLRCGLIAGATVDVWQADATGAMDEAGMRLRGRQRTDAQGQYHVETIVPGAAAGQAPRLNFRVTVPGKATLDTMLFLPEAVAGATNARDKQFDPLLGMTLIGRTSAQVTASFNVILDL